MINLTQFKMEPREESRLKALVTAAQPKLLAEFGSGLTTRFWAEQSEAKIVTWDNYPEWVAGLREAFHGMPWLDRIDFRLYAVTPEGPRTVEKDPVPWDGPRFDFLFLDGPRSAHSPTFGRSGSFRFAALHAAQGATIVWHDAQRTHEQEMARRYFGHCRRHRDGTVGWCQWQTPDGSARQALRRLGLSWI